MGYFKATFNLVTWSTRQRDLVLVIICILAQGVYLLTGYLQNAGFGFPLDDAWIYQTYARNLAENGQWAFVAGQPSTGSTSLLWTPLLVPGQWLNAFWWTNFVGLLCLIAAALGAARFLSDDKPAFATLIGLAVAVEWHMVWMAASGMETILFTALLIWFWRGVIRHDPAKRGHSPREGLTLGLFGGVLMLTRPEGALALAIAGLYGFSVNGPLGDRLKWGLMAGVGFGAALAVFLGFNYAISGVLLPNTFYAKQTEYEILRTLPLTIRFWRQINVAFVGAHLLLLPGVITMVVNSVRRNNRVLLLPLIWVVLHWLMYAYRLPVTFQHGRYIMPTIPFLVIYGIWGAASVVRLRSRDQAERTASMVWSVVCAALFPTILIMLGAPAYAQDVAFIEDEIVASAQWVAANTEPDTLIALHDIGAMGYFAPRPLLDLAGLVSPEVIPFMNSERQLLDYIIAEEAQYVIVFPGWSDAYTQLVTDPALCPVWSAAEQPEYQQASSDLGAMTVYAVSPDKPCLNP